MKDLDINFPLDKFEKLIIDIGWESLDDWFNFWNNKRNILSIDQYWNNKVNDDWIWGLEFTLASEPNGCGWKNEINKLIKNRELS